MSIVAGTARTFRPSPFALWRVTLSGTFSTLENDPMPQAKPKPPPNHTPAPAAAAAPGDVLTLAEAAAYLRTSAEEVLRLAREQGLPGRRVGDDCRFLRAALQDWLRT